MHKLESTIEILPLESQNISYTCISYICRAGYTYFGLVAFLVLLDYIHLFSIMSCLYVLISHICFRDAKAGTHKQKGWADSAYGMSKIGVTLMSFAHQREFNKDNRQDIIVNAVSYRLQK